MLAVRNLEVVYEDVMLSLRGASIQVPVGSIVALLGANGAGKTTLLRAVTGLLDVHRGKVTKGQVTLDDAAAADEIFSILMGEDVESRRGFIQRNAKDVRFLDI